MVEKESESRLAKLKIKILAYALQNAINYDGKAKLEKVLSHLFNEGLQREDVKSFIPIIKEEVDKVNKLSLEEQKVKFIDYENLIVKEVKEKGLSELKDAHNGKVVLRLAPYPSGALHLGNAKTYLLNALYAEKYSGTTLLVMDDTIGSKEKQIAKDAYKLIPESFKWLNVKFRKPIIYKSDRLKIYYKYAEEIIKLNKAYVCSCEVDKLRENREKGLECSCRQYTPEQQLKRWKLMFKASPGEYALRIKTSMQDPNPAFRDRVLFRISDMKHPRVGNKYKVWPMLEFSWAIDDHLLGITHIIRGKDLMIESDMEKYIWDIFKWKHPQIYHAGLIRIEGMGAKISKSKAQKEVASGEFIGWDDPRTWSMQSLKRRGILAEAIRQFVFDIGLNQNDITVPIDNLYSINRKIIDKECNRYSFIQEPIKLDIENMPDIKEIEVKIHPDKTETRKVKIGKEIYISNKDYELNKGKEVRLMHLFNIKLDKKTKFSSIENKDIPRIGWVSEFVNARILMEDGKWINGFAESNIKKLKKGSQIQFERFGFCKFDNINSAGEYEFWFSHN